MRKLIIILALVGAALAAAGQALPSGSVLFGQNTWLAPDGSVWTGKDGFGYKKLLGSDAVSNMVTTNTTQTISGAKTFTTPMTFLGSSPEKIKLVGASSGTYPAYLSFYESDGETRQGYVGFGSGINSDLYMYNTLGDAYLRVKGTGGANGLTYTHGSNERIVWHEGNLDPVTLSGSQTISGTKTFSSALRVTGGSGIGNGVNILSGSSNSGGLAAISGNETKFAGFVQGDNAFVVGYGTTTPGQHTGKFKIDLPTGNAEFSGKVKGQPATESNEFATLGQLSAPATYKVPYLFQVRDGMWDNSPDTILVQVLMQEDDYWDGSVDDDGWSVEFEIRGSITNSSIDNRLSMWFGRGPSTFSRLFNHNILQGSIPAQEFWIEGTLTKLGPQQIRYDIEFKTGDPAGVTSHTIQSGTISGLETGWNLETNPTNMFRLSSNSATPISMMVTHARFKKVPLNGTFISNL